MTVLASVVLVTVAIEPREIAFIVVPFIVRLGVYLLSLASPDGYIIP